MAEEKKITLKDLIDKRTAWVDEFYATLKKEQKENLEFYELVYDANIPTNLGYEQKTPSTARDWVDFGIMHYTLDNPKDVVKALSSSTTAKEQATMIEKFNNYWLARIILEIKENAKMLLWGGESFLKLQVYDTYYGEGTAKMGEDELAEFEAKRASFFPLGVQNRNPINVFPSPAGRGFWHPEVIEYFPMTVAEAQELCDRNKWEWDASGKKSTDPVKYTSYYSDTERCILIEDKPVLPSDVQPNYLGFCPYVHIPSGYGTSHYEGKPEYMYRSIFHGKKDMIKLQTRLLSQLDAILGRFAWPWVELAGDEEKIAQYYGKHGKGFVMNPNEVQTTPEGVTLTLHQGEQPPQPLFAHLGGVSAMAEVPPILGGQRPPGIYSGYGEVALLTTAKPLYKNPFKNLEDGLAVLMGMGARVMENVLKYKITLNPGEELNPAKIKGYYDNSVHLLAEPPEAADMRKTLGANLWKQGVISDLYNKVHYQDMSMEEALKEQDEQLAEKILNDPRILEMVGVDAMKRLGMEQAPEVEQALGGAAGAMGGGTPTGAASVPRYQRMAPGVEGGTLPQEGEIGQIGLE